MCIFDRLAHHMRSLLPLVVIPTRTSAFEAQIVSPRQSALLTLIEARGRFCPERTPMALAVTASPFRLHLLSRAAMRGKRCIVFHEQEARGYG